eukprot:11570159-Alexandrium_andersonii.AAC.1
MSTWPELRPGTQRACCGCWGDRVSLPGSGTCGGLGCGPCHRIATSARSSFASRLAGRARRPWCSSARACDAPASVALRRRTGGARA